MIRLHKISKIKFSLILLIIVIFSSCSSTQNSFPLEETGLPKASAIQVNGNIDYFDNNLKDNTFKGLQSLLFDIQKGKPIEILLAEGLPIYRWIPSEAPNEEQIIGETMALPVKEQIEGPSSNLQKFTFNSIQGDSLKFKKVNIEDLIENDSLKQKVNYEKIHALVEIEIKFK